MNTQNLEALTFHELQDIIEGLEAVSETRELTRTEILDSMQIETEICQRIGIPAPAYYR